MDPIVDVLNAQRGTSSLTQYQGSGSVHLDPKVDKLRQLIAQLKTLLAELPPEIAALLMGVLQDAEDLLAGGSAGDVQTMIERLQQIVQTLMELIAQLQAAGADNTQLLALLRGLANQLDASQRSALMMSLQKLRKLAAGDSLKGVDEVSLGSLDGTSLVEPNSSNVMLSLQRLIALAAVRPLVPAQQGPGLAAPTQNLAPPGAQAFPSSSLSASLPGQSGFLQNLGSGPGGLP